MNVDATSSTKQILIVDDTPANLRLLETLLSDQGYEVRLSPTGHLALMSIQQTLPDLILLDVCMPEMDGYEVCRQLKADDRTRDIPVIFLSALQEVEDKVKAFELGGVDYITKPFQVAEVTARVRHQLHILDLQRQLLAQQALLVAKNQQLQQEISYRKQAKTELRNERNLLRTLIDAIPDLIFFKNTEGQYLLCNQAFEDFVGVSADEILGQTAADLFSSEAAAKMQTQDRQVLSTRSPLRHEEFSQFPEHLQRSFDTYKLAIQNTEGELIGLIGVCRDITDRKAAETRLSRTTSRLSTLISSLQAGILVEDEHRQIVLINQYFCDLFAIALDPTQLQGINYTDLMAKSAATFALPDQVMHRINDILSEQQSVTAEELVLADGRILERDYVPIMVDGTWQGHLWQYRDITARKANEQALVQSSQAMQAFSNHLKQLHRLSVRHFDTFEELFEDYLTTGCQILPFSGGMISSLQQETYIIEAIEPQIEGLFPGLSCQLSDTLCLDAVRQRKTFAHSHFSESPNAEHHPIYQRLQIESYISTPIFVNEQIYGTLCFFSQAVRTVGFKSHEREIIELMAQSIGKFISSYQVEQQRHQAEVDLRESEARFRQLAEHIEDVFWILEPSEQKFAYISPAYAAIWGQSREAALQDPQAWQAAIHPEDVDRIVAKQTAGISYDEEYQIIRPDGMQRWIRDRAFPIYDDTGQPRRIVGIAEDVTDIKHQEQALRLIFEGTATKTGSEFFQSLVRYLAEVLQVRYALVTQTINRKQKRVKFLAFWPQAAFGDNQESELVNSPCEHVLEGQTVFHPDQVQSFYPQFQAFADWAVCSYFGVPLLNTNGEVIGHLAVLDDRPMISEQPNELILKIFAARAGAELERQTFENEIQQSRESADAANRAKSEFLANISHELRTPLNSILGFTQLILGTSQIDGQSREHLNIVYHSGEHLLALINDVLEMSKIEAGKISLVAEPFDLHALLHNLEEMFSLRTKVKDITLTFDCAVNVPQYVKTDESKLRQVLINLLSNAVKFTKRGQVRLRVHLSDRIYQGSGKAAGVTISSQSSPMLVAFTVEDTGPGIAPEELKTLFDPFTQTTTGRQSREGTGLGLSISQSFVQLMGGMIQVQTTLGEGSTFSFFIEAAPVVNPPEDFVGVPMPDCQLVERLAPEQPDYRILVVEDQLTNRQLLVQTLESIGLTVKAAEDGLAGLAIARDWCPHLIWMDIRMPRMDGYEATRQIKAAGLVPAPVIIGLTANTFEEERERVMAAGCDDFVRKPFKASQIFQMLAQHLPIRYVYKTDTPPALAPTAALETAPSELATLLKSMSPIWVQSVQQAAIKGADEQILQLVAALPEAASTLKVALIYWAQNFQFDAILEFLSTY